MKKRTKGTIEFSGQNEFGATVIVIRYNNGETHNASWVYDPYWEQLLMEIDDGLFADPHGYFPNSKWHCA